MAHQIAVQHGKATGRKFSMIVDENLHASIRHCVSRLTISGPKFDLWQISMATLNNRSFVLYVRRYCLLGMEMLIPNEDF